MALSRRDARRAKGGARTVPSIVVGCLALWAQLACAQDRVPTGRIDLQLAVEHSTGRYREPTATTILNTSFVARYRSQAWVAEIQVPYLQTRTEAASGGLPDAASAGASRERGLGDIWLKLGVEVREFDTDSTGVDLVLKLKTRTGDAQRGLGSGGVDVAVQADLLRAIGPWVGFGHVGYRHTGDVPGLRPYRDPWYGGVGAYRTVMPRVDVGAMLDLRQAIGRLGPLAETTVYAAWRQGGYRLQLHLTRGFAPASPDWAVGVTMRTRF